MDVIDNKIIRKKKLFYGVLIFEGLYLVFGIYGIATNQIVDTDSLGRFYQMPAAKIMLMVISLCLLVLSIFLGRSIGIKAKEDLSKVLKFVLFGLIYLFAIVLFYASGTGILEIVNAEYGPQKDLIVKGIVLNKYTETGSKNSKSYFMVIDDSLQDKMYHLQVNKQMYQNNNKGSRYIKVFKIGSLGLIYKHDDR
jgi:hypothetical protein